MVTPSQHRDAVAHVRCELSVSERRACWALGQARSTQRYQPRRLELDKVLVKRLHELAQQHPRYGYRRITAKLKEEQWHVNRKRVQRLWRAEGLKVPVKAHKRTRLGEGENACHRRKPEHAHYVWALDFLMDTTLSGGRLKFLTVIDEFSRSCLSIKVDRNLEVFASTLEARVLSETWRRDYNEQRPHGALAYRTPKHVLAEASKAGKLQMSRPTSETAQA